MRLLKANPIACVTLDDPPFLVVHGDGDKQVPYNQSELLDAALRQANVPVTFQTDKGGGHGGFNYDQIWPMVAKCLADYLPRRSEIDASPISTPVQKRRHIRAIGVVKGLVDRAA